MIHANLERLLHVLKADIVMMVEAYFDESGTHDGSPVMCVAGYLFDGKQCLHLDREWVDALRTFGVTRFHAVDCAQGVGEFSSLSPKDRTELTVRLIGIIKRRMNIGIAVSMSDTAFGQIKPPVYERGGPYLFCAMQVLAGVVGWADKHSYSGKIAYFFESGNKHEGVTHRAIDMVQSEAAGFSNLRFHSVTFGGKSDFRPLQAADILAYEWCKELRRLNMSAEKFRPMRRSLESLLEQPHIQQHFGPEDLREFFGGGDRTRLLEQMRRFDVVQ